jgi:hypothetical protein
MTLCIYAPNHKDAGSIDEQSTVLARIFAAYSDDDDILDVSALVDVSMCLHITSGTVLVAIFSFIWRVLCVIVVIVKLIV